MSTRRTFLKHTGLLSAAMSIPAIPFAAPKTKFKLGLQLYTIREAMEKDLRGTLTNVAGYGYQEVETYGFNYGNNKYYWGLEPKQAKQLMTIATSPHQPGIMIWISFSLKTKKTRLPNM